VAFVPCSCSSLTSVLSGVELVELDSNREKVESGFTEPDFFLLLCSHQYKLIGWLAYDSRRIN